MNSEKPSSWILTACLLLGMVSGSLIVFSQDATSLDQGLRDLAADELDPSALQFKAQAHFAAGVSFLAQGEKDKALEQFEKALQVDPESASLATRIAENLILLQQFEKAQSLLQRASESDDAPGMAFELLGVITSSQGEDSQAQRLFEEALRRDPSRVFSRQKILDQALKDQREDLALELVQEAVKVTSYEVEDMTALIGLYLKYAVLRPQKLKLLDQALESLVVKASEVAEEEPVLEVAIADVLMLTQRFEEAEKRLSRLKDFDPPLILAREKLIDLYVRSGETSKALVELGELADINPQNPRPYLLMGSLEADEGNSEKAESHFRKAMKIGPAFEAPYYELAALKLNQGDARQALEVLQEARNNLPQTFMLEFYSGLAMTSLRQYASALKFLRSAEQLAEEKEPSRLTGFFYFRKGSVQERLGQLQEAEDSFLKCLQKDPEDATTLNYLGYMWAEHGKKLDDAFEWIQKALDLEPDSEAILDSMGWVLFQQGKPEQALPYLEKAESKLTEPDPTILDHLGDVYLALDRLPSAKESFQKSLEIEFSEQVFEKWNRLLDGSVQ